MSEQQNERVDNVLDFDGQQQLTIDKIGDIDTSLRYAKIIFDIDVGCNTENPPLKMVYNIVKKEVDKVRFKYGQKEWNLRYALYVDDPAKGCYTGGNTCIIVEIPYVPVDIEGAQKMIVQMCAEIMNLLKKEYCVLYFDVSRAYTITNTYAPNGELFNTEANLVNIESTVNCIIETGFVTAAKELQDTMVKIKNEKNPEYYITPLFIYTNKYPSQANKVSAVSFVIQNNAFFPDHKKFVKSVKKLFDESMLKITNLTVI